VVRATTVDAALDALAPATVPVSGTG
jgi:hypothetical protein